MLGSCMNFFGAKLLESSEKAAAPTSGMHRNHPTVLELLFFCVFYFLTVFPFKGNGLACDGSVSRQRKQILY
jgi:hypothetical protein